MENRENWIFRGYPLLNLNNLILVKLFQIINVIILDYELTE